MNIPPVVPTVTGIGCIGIGGGIAAQVILTKAAWTTATLVASIALPLIGILLLVFAYFTSRAPVVSHETTPQRESSSTTNLEKVSIPINPPPSISTQLPPAATHVRNLSLPRTHTSANPKTYASSAATYQTVTPENSSLRAPSESGSAISDLASISSLDSAADQVSKIMPQAPAAVANQELVGAPRAPDAPSEKELPIPNKSLSSFLAPRREPTRKSEEILKKVKADAEDTARMKERRQRVAENSVTQDASNLMTTTARHWNNLPEQSDTSESEGEEELSPVRQKQAAPATVTAVIPRHVIERNQKIHNQMTQSNDTDDVWDDVSVNAKQALVSNSNK